MGLIPRCPPPDLPCLQLCYCCQNYQLYPSVEPQNSLFPFHIQFQVYSALSLVFSHTSVTATIRPLQITVIIIRISKKNKFLSTSIPGNCQFVFFEGQRALINISVQDTTQQNKTKQRQAEYYFKRFRFNNTETNNVEPKEGGVSPEFSIANFDTLFIMPSLRTDKEAHYVKRRSSVCDVVAVVRPSVRSS